MSCPKCALLEETRVAYPVGHKRMGRLRRCPSCLTRLLFVVAANSEGLELEACEDATFYIANLVGVQEVSGGTELAMVEAAVVSTFTSVECLGELSDAEAAEEAWRRG